MKTYGPYLRKDGRSHVIHVHDDGRRQTQSYPRYLLEQALKIKLSPKIDVHHKDLNPANNVIDNFRQLTRKEHAKEHSDKEWYYFDCPVCGIPSRKEMRNVRGNWKRGSKGPFCSRRCAGKA